MQNLYELLGARPNDDADSLRRAYRRAAKESHPDHHGGNPEAAMRFRQIAEAYDILRDSEHRAAYDQLLESERRPFRWKLKRALSDVKRHIAYDVTAGAVLAIVLAVGYDLFAGMPQTRIEEAAGIAAVLPAGPDGAADRAATPQMPILIPAAAPVAPAAAVPSLSAAAADRGAPETTKDGPVSPPAEQVGTVTSHNRDSEIPIDQVTTGVRTADSGKGREAELPDGHGVQTADVPFSAAEKHDVGNASPPDVTASGDKRDGRRHEPASANAGDVKHLQEIKQLPDIKISARPPAAGKRQAVGRPPFEQASLEARTPPAAETGNTPACAGAPSCSGDVPPLFGVGN
jgi:DnaJ domain